ncbi:separin-like [Antedon mediterranea]|uniref:separin-like n=1 Tax=Antedon mediterranea TaxID=105859 RepID=UPI003AF67E8F
MFYLMVVILIYFFQAYLAPLHNQKRCREKANKYGLFAMKLLHVCVQCWTDCNPNNPMLASLIVICNTAYSSLLIAKNMMKTSPLALEKLLFHNVSQILKKGLFLDGLAFSENLLKQMQECHSEHFQEDTVENDYDTVAKQSYNLLWKACVELEISEAKQNSSKLHLVLQFRQQALSFLLLSNMPLSNVVDLILKSGTEFEKGSYKLDQTEKWKILVKFFNGSITHIANSKHFSKQETLLEKQLSSVIRLGIQTVKFCSFLHDTSQAKYTLEFIRKEFNEAKVGVNYNVDVFHSILELLQCLIMFEFHTVNKKQEGKQQKLIIQNVAGIIVVMKNFLNVITKLFEKNMLNDHLAESLVEALEMIRKYTIATIYNDAKDKNLYNDDFSDVFVDFLISNVKILEFQQVIISKMTSNKEVGKLKHTKQQMNVKRQLSVLHLLANILIFQLDEKRMIEHNCLEPKSIIGKVVMVLQKHVSLIEQVSSGRGGSVQTNEHRWLGCNAFNLGLLIYRQEWYKDAILPLSLACNQLRKWCIKGQCMNIDNLQEIRLFTKLELLADCQRKAGFLSDAIASLEKSIALMSTTELVLKSTVELWIKCKRDSVKNGQEEIQTRTVKDAILEEQVDGVVENQVTALLQIELDIYKNQRYNTVVEQYAVVCDLLEIYNCEQFALKRAVMLIHLAKLLICRDFDTDFSSEDCLREAISLLEQLLNITRINQSDAARQSDKLVELSFAYFWLYVCEMESTVSQVYETIKQDEITNNKRVQQTSKCEEEKLLYSGSFIAPTSNLGLENNVMEPLNKAVGIWRQLVDSDTLACHFKLELQQCMQMAAAIYFLQNQPLQRVVTLLLASTIGSEEEKSQHRLEVCSILSTLGNCKTNFEFLEMYDENKESGVTVELIYCLLAQCKTFLYSGKVKDAVDILVKIKKTELLEQRNRQAYMIKACVMELSAELLNLPTDMTDGCDLHKVCPDLPTPLDLLHDSLKLRMGVARLVLGNDMCSSCENKHNVLLNPENIGDNCGMTKWSIIGSVLDSLLYIGRQYTEQGCVRQAQCYLSEGLTLAEKFMVPRRCSEFHMDIARVKLVAGELVEAKANIERSKYFLNMDENNFVLIQGSTNKSSSVSNSFSFDVSDDEDNFIHSRKLSLTTEHMSDNMFCMDSSPSLKVCKLGVPDYSKHPDCCHCSACVDIILQRLDMEMLILQAEVCNVEGDHAEEINMLRAVNQFFSDVIARGSMEFQSICTLQEVTQDTRKKHLNASKTPESIYQGLNSPLLHLYANMSSCFIKQERFSLAMDYYEKGLDLFQTSTFFLSKDLNTLCKLHFTGALCNIHQCAIEYGCESMDIFSCFWKGQHSKPKVGNNTGDKLAKRFEELSICCNSSNLKCQETKDCKPNWIHLVSTEVRPEMARYSKSLKSDSEKSLNECELGIIHDILDEPEKCTMKAKRGNVNYSVKKSRTKSKVKQETRSKKIQKDVFSFDTDSDDGNIEDCSITSTSKKIRQQKKERKCNKDDAIFCDDKDNDHDLKPNTTETKKGTRAKSSKKSKVAMVLANQFEEYSKTSLSNKTKQKLLDDILVEKIEEEEQQITKRTLRDRRKKSTQDVGSKDEKPCKLTRGRQKKSNDQKKTSEKKQNEKVEAILETQIEIKSRKRGGRKPKTVMSVETMRNGNYSLNDVFELSAISELSEDSLQTPPFINDDIQIVNTLTIDEMNMHEHSEIEILRVGSESDDIDDRKEYIRKSRLPEDKHKLNKILQADKKLLEIDDVIKIQNSVSVIKDTLNQAYNLIKHKAPIPIFNQVCQLLAMCHGDVDPQKFAFYLNKSMANTLRHQKLLSLTRLHRKLKTDHDIPNNEEINKLMIEKQILQLNQQDNSVLKITQQLPEGWTVVTMAAVGLGVDDTKSKLNDVDCLLVSRLVNGFDPLVLKIPVKNDDDSKLLSEIVAELQAIISKSVASAKELDKKSWWISRQGLDQRMKNLMVEMEDKLLNCWKGIFIGQPNNTDTALKLSVAAKILQQKICLKHKISLHACQMLLQCTPSLSFQQLTSILSSVAGLERGTDELLAALELVRNLTKTLEKDLKETKNQTVILVLDKHLQQLPWENISTARSQVMCRIPSLDFLACHLKDMELASSILHQGINVDNTYYVLNPINDLDNTQLMFQKWFSNDLSWNGVVGRGPNKDEYSSGLTEHDLFIYCGHGSGSQYLNGDDIQKIRCRALTMLMGCSSGRLKYSGSLEATGMALNYLVAGCPCVVGNLWDVTDRDIDRFTKTLLKSWLEKSKDSSYITDYILDARNACKLTALIGYAPVTYGLPVYLK